MDASSMAKIKIEHIEPIEPKSRFMRFTPTISMGNIVTALAVFAGAITAWVQLNNQVSSLAASTKVTVETLTNENTARKTEIKDSLAKSDADRDMFYKKMSEAQSIFHEEIKDLTVSIGTRFDRLDDKLDRKQDKKL